MITTVTWETRWASENSQQSSSSTRTGKKSADSSRPPRNTGQSKKSYVEFLTPGQKVQKSSLVIKRTPNSRCFQSPAVSGIFITGYFSAFFLNFLSIASEMSMSKTSEKPRQIGRASCRERVKESTGN